MASDNRTKEVRSALDLPDGSDDLFARLPIRNCVNRVPWIVSRCTDKVVVDIGCADETAFLSKRGGSKWLHGEIREKAKDILGIDNSASVAEWKIRYPTEFQSIVPGQLANICQTLKENSITPDIVVCGELIEHLDSPHDLFKELKVVAESHSAEILVTTPNPFGYQAFLMALLRKESQHIDHRFLLTPKILIRQAIRNGFELVEMHTAYTEYNEFYTTQGWQKYILRIADTLCFRPFQRCFPGVGGTLICSFRYRNAPEPHTSLNSKF